MHTNTMHMFFVASSHENIEWFSMAINIGLHRRWFSYKADICYITL